MVQVDKKSASNGSNGPTFMGSKLTHDAEIAWQEAKGASQIGPFDYVPPMGFREYWYPALFKKDVTPKKPVCVTMLGEEIVFFGGKGGKVYAMYDWCPHRSSRLSQGMSVFPGTITCEYHGYTFNGKGECVAGLIDDANTPLLSKMKGKAYPTAEHDGIVYVWMGETDPVPLEEDLPPEILDLRNHSYHNSSMWDANWTEPVNQGIDYHEAYLHRRMFHHLGGWKSPFKFKFHGLLSKDLSFFRPRLSNYGGIKIVYEDEKRVCSNPVSPSFGPVDHSAVNGKWPRNRWYTFLRGKPKSGSLALSSPEGTSLLGTPKFSHLLGTPKFSHAVELPSFIRTGCGSEKPAISLHLRWMVPVTFDTCRVWTYTIGRRPKTILGRIYKNLWYILWRKPNTIKRVNEWEDLVTFQKGRLRYDLPQKLSTLDTHVIYFRRHLAQRSRDFQRLGGAYDSSHPPIRTAEEWAQIVAVKPEEAAVVTAST